MSKHLPPAPTASAVDPCPTVIQIVGCPGTGSLPSTFAPPDHPVIHQYSIQYGHTQVPCTVWSYTSIVYIMMIHQYSIDPGEGIISEIE